MSGLENTRGTIKKFYQEVDGEYLLDLQGIETYCKVNSDRYDEINKTPTILYHLSFVNYKLKQLGDNDIHTYEPMKVCPTSGVKIANFKRKPEYRLPFSDIGFKPHSTNFIDMRSTNFVSSDDVVVQITKWVMVNYGGIKRKKYFCTKRFADVPIVSIIKKL